MAAPNGENAAIAYEASVSLSSAVRRITQANPGILTGPGTNTYIIGDEDLLILDPGEDSEAHYDAILSAVAGKRVIGVAATHAHPDHWPLAPRLSQALGAKSLGARAWRGFCPDRLLSDADMVEGRGWSLRVISTPGHAQDHLCFHFVEEQAVFTGDHIMEWSTTVIARPDGSLHQYLASLEKLRRVGAGRLYPAHGHPVTAVDARIAELAAHRRMRTEQILAALGNGARTVAEIVREIYADVDPRLHSMAGHSVLAHLEALMEEKRVCSAGRESDGGVCRYRLR